MITSLCLAWRKSCKPRRLPLTIQAMPPATHWALYRGKPRRPAWQTGLLQLPTDDCGREVFAKGPMQGTQPHSLWQRGLEQVVHGCK